MPHPHPSDSDPRLASLLDALELLLAQAQAYELALPPNNIQALTAIAQLREMAQQALNEARDLVELPNQPTANKHPLSPREYEVITLTAQGLTNKEIAYRLGLSERTVQFHLNGVFNKTGTNSRTKAVALALRNNWL